MVLIGFLQAQNCSNYVGSWRHPASHSDFLSPDYYRRIGAALEAGKFQLAFFDDRLAMPDILGADHKAAVEAGVRVVEMDPATILMVMGRRRKNSASALPIPRLIMNRFMSRACSPLWTTCLAAAWLGTW